METNTEYISIDEFIKRAKSKGILFGKGDAYNRIRYYIKLGWLPNMKRIKNVQTDEVQGHYPAGSIDTLLAIEELKKAGMTNKQITMQLKKQNRSIHINTDKIIKYTVISVVAIICITAILNGIGIIKIGKSKTMFIKTHTESQLQRVKNP